MFLIFTSICSTSLARHGYCLLHDKKNCKEKCKRQRIEYINSVMKHLNATLKYLPGTRRVEKNSQINDIPFYSPLLLPSGPRRMVHSSIVPKAVNNCLTSSSVCCLLSIPTNSFLSAGRPRVEIERTEKKKTKKYVSVLVQDRVDFAYSAFLGIKNRLCG